MIFLNSITIINYTLLHKILTRIIKVKPYIALDKELFGLSVVQHSSVCDPDLWDIYTDYIIMHINTLVYH